jgi:hypothetical protein
LIPSVLSEIFVSLPHIEFFLRRSIYRIGFWLLYCQLSDSSDFLTFNPIDSNTLISNSISCAQQVAANNSASVTDSAAIDIILLFIQMDASNKKVDHPLTLRRVSESFAQSESEYPVISNSIFGLPSHITVGFKNSPLSGVLGQYFITQYIAVVVESHLARFHVLYVSRLLFFKTEIKSAEKEEKYTYRGISVPLLAFSLLAHTISLLLVVSILKSLVNSGTVENYEWYQS